MAPKASKAPTGSEARHVAIVSRALAYRAGGDSSVLGGELEVDTGDPMIPSGRNRIVGVARDALASPRRAMWDPTAFSVALVGLVLVAAAAGAVPGRVASLDPLVVLKPE